VRRHESGHRALAWNCAVTQKRGSDQHGTRSCSCGGRSGGNGGSGFDRHTVFVCAASHISIGTGDAPRGRVGLAAVDGE